MTIIIGTSIYCHMAITKKNVGTMLVRKKLTGEDIRTGCSKRKERV